MKSTTEMTAERLRSLLHYDPETGVFTWRVATSFRVHVGQVAGCLDNTGYLKVGVDGCRHLLHRLAWLHTYGVWPSGQVDHINRIRVDNRIANLRDVPPTGNIQNSGISRRNRSGVKGVSWVPKAGKWKSFICASHKYIYLGLFSDIDDAIAARKAAEAKYHPFALKDSQHA